MNVIPELNLNKHPKDCKNGSLVDAVHMMIDKDSYLLHSENSIENIPELNDKIKDIIKNDYKIIYAIPCNIEIIFFIKIGGNNILKLLRYNEKYNEIKYCCDIDYHNGNFVSTFTYNKNNLIISFSEYGDNLQIPLKVLDLGEFENPKPNPEFIHALNPEVIIPSIDTKYIIGNAYKGWYYIFIRYKLSNDNYTQWFNTNASIFIDAFKETNIINYIVSDQTPNRDNTAGIKINGKYTNTDAAITKDIINVNCSTDNDIASISFINNINNIDKNYNNYQLGFIIIRKDYTKCYRTEDISSDNTSYILNTKELIEEDVNNMVTSYINYYNVKNIDNYNNLLYIGNYNEFIEDIDTTGIIINIDKLKKDNIETNSRSINNIISRATEETNTTFVYGKRKNSTYQLYTKEYKGKVVTSDFIYTVMPWWPAYSSLKMLRCTKDNEDDILQVRMNNIIYTCKRKNLMQVVDYNFPNDVHNFIILDESGNEHNITTPSTNRKYGYEDWYAIDFISIWKVNDKWLSTNPNHSDSSFRWDGVYVTFNDELTIYEGKSVNTGDDNTTIPIENIPVGDYLSTLETCSVLNDEYYNFFIHFINKYGEISKGYQLNNFNINTEFKFITNNIGDKLIYAKDTDYFNFSINKLPENYIGWFVTFEKFQSIVKHRGLLFHGKHFISQKLNTDDTINFDFNKIKILNGDGSIYLDQYITNKKLLIADTYENIGLPTHIKLEYDLPTGTIEGVKRTYLYNDNYTNLYSNKIKTLIPCSSISYEINTNNKINTKNSFVTKCYVFYTEQSFTYNGVTGNYRHFIYNSALKLFQFQFSYAFTDYVNDYNAVHPYTYKEIDVYDEIPYETWEINNKPQVQFFPIRGINTTNEWEKSFSEGTIVENKNAVDLFIQKNTTYYDNYPKTYLNYNDDENYINTFSKTVRRSNPIQDESDNVAWRFFETDNYKNIIENKGDIINIVSIGNIMFVHTQHSLFQFNADQGLKTGENNNISIAAVDIWELPYKEVLTSNLGYAGINKQYHAIVGQFGYIFYEQDKQRFFRYDNNSIEQIDLNINNFIRTLKDFDVAFLDDVNRDRLIITLYNKQIKYTISYNYKYNTFVSRHLYNDCIGYSTKNNIYLLNYSTKKELKQFTNNNYNKYNNFTDNSVSIILNTDYEINKILEFIKYRFNLITESTEFDNPANIRNSFYSGEILRILSEECDTKDLNIFINKHKETINSVKNPNKPYRELGNWNFNYIRNNIAKYDNDRIKSDNITRFYGNWFVITFKFTPNTIGENCIEIESIDYKITKNLT